MTTAIALSTKGQKLATLCKAEGLTYDDLPRLMASDNLAPCICMTEECDHIDRLESDQTEGFCEACGGQTMVSVLVLAEMI